MPVVVMGVAGCGKSAVAERLAARLALGWLDGDDLHLPASVARMRAGIALEDHDRWPWLDRVAAQLADAVRHPNGLVVACSALKRAYRDRLRLAVPGLRFLFLEGDAETILARMQGRDGHFMPASLLASQLRTLEKPGAGEVDVLQMSIDDPVSVIVEKSLRAWGLEARHPEGRG
ncbi:MAG: gluconokinase [Caldimonas sp.]